MLAGRLSRTLARSLFNARLMFNFSKVKPVQKSGPQMTKIDHTAPIPPMAELSLHEKTVIILEQKGITALFPIQYHTLEDIIEGLDIIAKDKTGSGKTLAYALPLTERLRRNRDGDADVANPDATRKPKVLVMVPTRELAIQIRESFQAYGRHTGLRSTVVFGGVGQ